MQAPKTPPINLPPIVLLYSSMRLRRLSSVEGPSAIETLCARLWLCRQHFECTGAENAVPKSAAYSCLWQVFYITVYASSTIKHFVRTFKGRHFGRRGFLYYSLSRSKTLFARLGLAFSALAALKMPPKVCHSATEHPYRHCAKRAEAHFWAEAPEIIPKF